jgi:WD40 repeat protein
LDDQNSFEYYDYWFSSASGTSRFSPDGTKYAHFSRVDDLQLYDFDRSSGQLSNHQKIELFETPRDSSDHKFGSVEWSPNGRFIYTCAQDTLLQIDTWENDIQSDGIRFIDEYNGTLDPFPTTFEVMALAPDCKIYMCSGNGSDSYHVIKKPNELGIDCNFMQNGIKLPQGAGSANIPLHPRWRVDEQHKCDNTITSVFGLEVYYRHNLKVYPNPTDGPLSIELPEGFIEGQLEVYDMEGVLIMNQKINPNESPLEISIINLPPGNYNIEIYPIRNFDRRYFTSQVIKIN